ncbi:MAG: chitobiase/beta-hexosaminidase C-terminal domain-containing protein [Ignavibacteriales bacterium]|nr:chitobiase/beta-hexosaminidase C-terminal domain-containing protein [Ignavibacteriales bacterium]
MRDFNILPVPSISTQSGFYSSSITVSASHSLQNVTIRFTSDGTIPNTSSDIYSTSLQVDSTTVVRFLRLKMDILQV